MAEQLLVIMSIGTILTLVVVFYRAYRNSIKKEKEDDERYEKKCAEETEEARKKKILEDLEKNLRHVFGVELDTIHERETQDEVVRVMDLLAHRAAAACVSQDKSYRGQETYRKEYGNVQEAKLDWAKTRKLALQICPELADRLPHFSEFEPLKSYREEHLLQKKAKQELQAK